MSTVSSLPQEASLPRGVSCDRSHLQPRNTGRGRAAPIREAAAPFCSSTFRSEKLPVSPFVVASCPAPPVKHANEPPLPCRGHRPKAPAAPAATAPGFLLRPHSQTPAFETPARPKAGTASPNGGPWSPSCVSRTLRFKGHVASGRYSAGPLAVCPLSRDGIVSRRFFWERIAAFQGAERRSSSLTPQPRMFTAEGAVSGSLDNLGIVSFEAYRQAITRLSWLSYSRPLDLPEVPESGQRLGPSCRQVRNSPRRHTLNGPGWPEPRGGI